MTDYSRHNINGLRSIRSLVCDILEHDGPDGHTDGSDIIAEEIWRRVRLWKFCYDEQKQRNQVRCWCEQ